MTCRAAGLDVDVVPATVRAFVTEQQRRHRLGEIAISTARGNLIRIKMLTHAIWPERDALDWMNACIKFLKELDRMTMSRNASRQVALPDARIFGRALAENATTLRETEPGRRATVRAHTLAREGLAIAFLSEIPIRRGSLTNLDLARHFDPTFSRVTLSPEETKEKKSDVRPLSPALAAQLRAYVDQHRSAVAPETESRLFLGSHGAPVTACHLTKSIGDMAEQEFEKRVTPHVFRNMISSFIVSEAPAEAALATRVLNHASQQQDETYRRQADQIIASQALADATTAAAGKIGAGRGRPPAAQARRRRPPRRPPSAAKGT